MLRRFCILDFSKHRVAFQGDYDSILVRHLQCRYSQDRLVLKNIYRLEWTSKWFVKRERESWSFGKTIRWAFWQLSIILLSLFASQATGDCSVLCHHSVWWGKTKGLVYYHCLSQTASSEKRESLLVVYMFAVFASGARTVKMFYFARLWYHLKKASRLDNFRLNKVIKFRTMLRSPLLLIDSWRYGISSENGGRNTKTPALIAGALQFNFNSILYSHYTRYLQKCT